VVAFIPTILSSRTWICEKQHAYPYKRHRWQEETESAHSVGYALSAAEGARHRARPLREHCGTNLTLSEHVPPAYEH
jgi:hypothetical protein